MDLFHIGVGPTTDDRVLAISIYSDGFLHIPDFDATSKRHKGSFRKFKPWACRKHAKDPLELTDRARDAIYQFIDQPGACLRNGIDEIDFEKIENDDLSQIPPPGFEPSDWLLVDSKEKMMICLNELEVCRSLLCLLSLHTLS